MEKKLGAQELLSRSIAYSGWLYKEESSFLSKKFCKRYCVLHNGHFFYFLNAISKDACGCFSLAGYSVQILDDEPKKYNNCFKLVYDGSVKQPTYVFAASSMREWKEWNENITREVEKIAFGNIDYEDDYDYAQFKPTDISFSDPERFDFDSQQVLMGSTANDENSPCTNGFKGPTSSLQQKRCSQMRSESMTPVPMPRKVPSDTDLRVFEQRQKLSSSADERDFLRTKCNDTNLFSSGDSTLNSTPPPIPNRGLKRDAAVPKPISRSTLSDRELEEKNLELKPRNNHQAVKQHSSNIRYEVNEPTRNSISVDHATSKPAPPPVPQRIVPQPNSRTGPYYADDDVMPQSMYQLSIKREMAEEMLKRHGLTGLYLIRKNSEEKHILSVYTAESPNSCRHYIIFQKFGHQYLAQEPAPRFGRIKELLVYYMENYLPTCNVRLSRPYR